MYENGKIRPAEVNLRIRGAKDNDGGGGFN
jgi:hypothetical protein